MYSMEIDIYRFTEREAREDGCGEERRFYRLGICASATFTMTEFIN